MAIYALISYKFRLPRLAIARDAMISGILKCGIANLGFHNLRGVF
ncbi:MAG: hypothetical protein SOW25_05750 [Helicobacter sp.]|nr:hypothetical protein [Helicobacteraceae bacterium]MDY3113813.1 hypothetical protein [Helicobacter sp.]